jgi:hypothetical protein
MAFGFRTVANRVAKDSVYARGALIEFAGFLPGNWDMEITRSIFESQRQRRFGAANPERMPLAFWEWMVRGSEDDRTRDNAFSEKNPAVLGYLPYAVRRFFGEEGDYSAGPIWNFDRMGATRTPHPDGRMICIGGEHEDHYDPDFCIYNDAVVIDLDGSIEIYGYPKDLFPPTDFHTATRFGNQIIIIGRLGYAEDRHLGTTPVFALDLAGYRIEQLPSHGEIPGWVFGHETELDEYGFIAVRGGEVVVEKYGEQIIRRNFDDFVYDIGTGTWKRLTNRKWWQFSVTDEAGKVFMMGPPFRGCALAEDDSVERYSAFDDPFIYVMPKALLPRSFAYETTWSDEPSIDERILVTGFPVTIKMSAFHIDIVIEGEMDEDMANALAEDIKGGVEADTGRRCVLRRYT